MIRFSIQSTIYRRIIKPIIFQIDPEAVHDFTVKLAELVGKTPIKYILPLLFSYQNPMLSQNLLNAQFKNPLGLAAGFDKSGKLTSILPYTGLGHFEVGSVTYKKHLGNPKKRVWRMPKHKSLQIYYGMPNLGAVDVEKRLKNKKVKIPYSISIAATPTKENLNIDSAIVDVMSSLDHLSQIPTYMTINVSCPNAIGGCMFMDPKALSKLLDNVCQKYTTPIMLKISPDVSDEHLREIVRLAIKHKIDGFICSNLTKNPHLHTRLQVPGNGGISGEPVREMSNELIRKLYKLTNGKKVIIGLGGVMSAQQAYEKIKLGANLLEAITGYIFEGPQLIGQINEGLVKLLKEDGYKNISEAVGVDA